MKIKLILLFQIILVACQTNNGVNQDYVQCDTTIFVDCFPVNIVLDSSVSLDVECYGPVEVNIIDSLLIVQNMGEPFFQIYNLPTINLVGEFGNKGNGPGEFIVSKRFSVLYNNDGHYFVEIYNDEKLTMERVDLTETILQKKSVAQTLSRKPQRAMGVFFVNDSLEFDYCLNDKYTQVVRYVKNRDSLPREIMSAKKLNSSRVKNFENLNLLTSVIAINRAQLLVAEAPLAHNQINIYSILGDSVSRTICLDDELKSIDRLEAVDRNSLVRYYGNIRGYDRFFAVLYVEKQKAKKGERILPSLHFFTWEGEPLASVKLSEICDSFDIDFINKKLITLDIATERLRMYDFPSVDDLIQI